MIANICSFDRMEAAIKEFQPFKAPGPDGLYLVLLRKGWNQLKGYYHQRWSRGHKARGQGQGHKKNPRPRPRTAFPRTDTLEAKDRNARGQGQGPRTQARVLSKKKKKKVFTKIFQAISAKKRFPKKFSSA